MGALRLAVVLCLVFSSGASADTIERWRPFIAEAAARFAVPEDWIVRVMHAESGGRTMLAGKPITSRAGAMGLMQLMPATWAELREAHGLGSDPHDPRDNILAGVAYLRSMYDRFGYPGLFAAYNAGPGRYSAHLSSGRALPGETIAYLASVAPDGAMTEPPIPAPGSLFFPLGRAPMSQPATTRTANNSLFVDLATSAR